MSQPLSNLVVLDFSTLLPGPLATLMLAEAGAEVIKIESLTGDPVRQYEPRFADTSAVFAMLNRGKRSVALDLKSPDSKRVLAPLLARADILVEQFRPGVMQRLGLDYQTIHAINPRLIYCSITGYGQTGPRALQAGHDLNYLGNTGLLSLLSQDGGQPTVPPAQVADIGGGSFAAVLNILLALRQRDLTGEGQYLDIAMSDAMFTFAWMGLAQGFATAGFPAPGSLQLYGASPRYQLYPTKDRKLVACAALEEKFWQKFCSVIRLPAALADDGRDPEGTKRAVREIIAERTSDQWQPIFSAADCCATIVTSLEAAVGDPHFAARGLFAHRISFAQGDEIRALPLPIDPSFRSDVKEARPSPSLAEYDLVDEGKNDKGTDWVDN